MGTSGTLGFVGCFLGFRMVIGFRMVKVDL